MKKVILVTLLIPYISFGQVVENFESGSADYWIQSTEGHWKADTTASISGVFSFHHIFDNAVAGSDQAGIELKNLHPSEGITRWAFSVKYEYDPSSSNNWCVFLISDSDPAHMMTDGYGNGFAVGVNLSGYDDTLRLYKFKESRVTTLVTCGLKWQSSAGIDEPVKITVERSPGGLWNVEVCKMNGESLSSDSENDAELFPFSWFGIFYRYSSAKDRLLWFDDLLIEGIFYEDNEAPAVTELKVTGKNSVELTFNEVPDEGYMLPENISLNSAENKAIAITRKNEFVYDILFSGQLTNKSVNHILIDKVCDIRNNCIMNLEIPFTPLWPEKGDVIISEIMADPIPEISLPGLEYLEIANRTEFSFPMKNWLLRYGDQGSRFPEISIGPSERLILCSISDTLILKKFGKTVGLKPFPVLTDNKGIICLADSLFNLIHGLEYTSDWYYDELKAGGGWSLEMIDTDFPFHTEENWKASVSRIGGTPGSENSVSGDNPDLSFYGIQHVFPIDSNSVLVRFTESVFSLQEKMNSVKIRGNNIRDIFSTDHLLKEYCLKIDFPLQSREIYDIEISDDVVDFAGNKMIKGNFRFGLPEAAFQGDLLFNELLFNPFPGDHDYLELFNNSESILDASRLQVVSVNESSDTSNVYVLSDEPVCILPGSYYAITPDRLRVSDRYFSTDPEFLFETSSFPPMSDDEGHLILYNKELDLIDEVVYNKSMHYSLLSDDEGVALEKTGPHNKSGEMVNWHSASEISGWGTPGAPNSVYDELPVSEDRVTLSSSRITPDNDGNEDALAIQFNLTGNGNVISLSVFDETGSYVTKIASNMLIGTEGSLVWDGTSADGSPVRNGIYVILISLYDDTGKTSRWKKVCTVIR